MKPLPEMLVGETQAKLLGLLRRFPRTIKGLAKALRLTDNAVRLHIAALGRDRMVEEAGFERDTGGKPARLYRLTAEGEELFPKAYAAVLGGLLDEITRTEGRERAVALLRAVGSRAAASAAHGDNPNAKVEAAADALRALGGEIDVQQTAEGWRLQGHGCPFSALTSAHAELCALAQTIVSDIVGQPVTECCERGERPRCAFAISAA